MNETTHTMQNHRSIRKYLDKDIPEVLLREILRSIQSMPTSINAQHLSIIVIKDKDRKEQIAKLAGDQSWIAQAPVFLVFVADLYKTSLAGKKHGKAQLIHESSEGSLTAIFDAGIALGGAIVASESFGLGIVPIGGIRRNPDEMIRLLDLPQYTYPVAGLVMGFPSDLSAKKPRMSLESFAHKEHYDKAAVEAEIDMYDQKMSEYYIARGDKATDWSSQIAATYSTVYYPKVHPTMIQQGFKGDK